MDKRTLIDLIAASTRELEVCVPSRDFYSRPGDFSTEHIRFVDAGLLLENLAMAEADEAADELGLERDSTDWDHKATLNEHLPVLVDQEYTPFEQTVVAVIAGQLGIEPEKIGRNSRFKQDLGTDSLDDIELVMAIEDEFLVELPDESIENITHVQQVFELKELSEHR